MLQKKLHKVTVNINENSYPVYIFPKLVNYAGKMIHEAGSKGKYVVVTDKIINEKHGEELRLSLQNSGLEPDFITVPSGEETKSWKQAGTLIGELLQKEMDRHSTILAFGGGVIGDLAGFVASIYMRGINLIQIPTTLLAQVDSSIGGKTAVNHPLGKNLIGAFKHPSLVITDPNILKTLPENQIRSGLAEVIKHGVIADEGLLSYIEANVPEILKGEATSLTKIIKRSVEIKVEYIRLDEKETTGIRALLNYGHTVGHALETITRSQLNHGEAVALGMLLESRISEKLGLINESMILRQDLLLKQLGFETSLPSVNSYELTEIMRYDKKVKDGSIRFVLPTGIGTAPVLKSVPENIIIKVLEAEET
jgi:3-dehydroquinate synthase